MPRVRAHAHTHTQQHGYNYAVVDVVLFLAVIGMDLLETSQGHVEVRPPRSYPSRTDWGMRSRAGKHAPGPTMRSSRTGCPVLLWSYGIFPEYHGQHSFHQHEMIVPLKYRGLQ